MLRPQGSSASSNSDCPSSPATLKPGDIAVVVNNGDTLNLRVRPGLDKSIITKVSPSTLVTVISGPQCADGYRWYEIGFSGQDGWAAEVGPDGQYNLILNGQPLPNPSQPTQVPNGPSGQNGDCPAAPAQLKPGDIAVVTNKDLNLRVQPDPNANVIRIIPNFSSVTIISGPVCNSGVRWFEVGYAGSDGWSAEVSTAGEYHMISNGASVPTPQQQPQIITPPLQQQQTSTAQAPTTIVPAPATAQPVQNTGICGSFWLVTEFCNMITGKDGVQAADVNTTCNNQCVKTAHIQRPDLDVWAKGAGTSDAILAIAENEKPFSYDNQIMQVRVRNSEEDPNYGEPEARDLVIWPSGCGGAWSGGGHIGYVDYVKNGKIAVIDSNWIPTTGPVCTSCNDVEIDVLSCMRFVTYPYLPVQQSFPPEPKCSHDSGLDWLLCQAGL